MLSRVKRKVIERDALYVAASDLHRLDNRLQCSLILLNIILDVFFSFIYKWDEVGIAIEKDERVDA